jgi:hypothetical protein
MFSSVRHDTISDYTYVLESNTSYYLSIFYLEQRMVKTVTEFEKTLQFIFIFIFILFSFHFVLSKFIVVGL